MRYRDSNMEFLTRKCLPNPVATGRQIPRPILTKTCGEASFPSPSLRVPARIPSLYSIYYGDACGATYLPGGVVLRAPCSCAGFWVKALP